MLITLHVYERDLVALIRFLNQHHAGPYFINTCGMDFKVEIDSLSAKCLVLLGESFSLHLGED